MSQADQADENHSHQPETDSGDADMAGRGIGSVLSRDTVGRRTLMKGIGVSAAGAVGLGSDYGMVDDADALVPLVLGAAAVAAGLGWTLRETEVIGSDPPAEGLTAGALEQDVYETARTRKSTNASTFVDNRNIINTGFENSLYVDGKVAAIEALNAEKSQSELETAALGAMKEHAATVEKNLLKSWNESCNELASMETSIAEHPDLSVSNILVMGDSTVNMAEPTPFEQTLADGTTISVEQIGFGTQGYDWDLTDSFSNPVDVVTDQTVTYMHPDDWTALWSDLQTAISNVESGLKTWVSNAYSEVQSGAIDTKELITPQERAEMLASEGAAAQAIADLAALNIPIASGTEYEIEQLSTGAVIRGRLALTDDTQTVEAGSTYNPSSSTFSGKAYFVYDVAEGSGSWSAYEEGIDGGVITLTQEPYSKTTYTFETSKDETVSVDTGNFTPTDGNGTEVDPQNATAWEADVSSRLENDIANINSVDFFANVEQSRIETVQLQSEFSVKSIADAETGESKDSVEFTSAEPQTDSNYITQQEWKDLQEQNQKLIEKYEASQNNGGGGIDLGQFDMFGLPGELIALAGAGVAILLGKSD